LNEKTMGIARQVALAAGLLAACGAAIGADLKSLTV
jgi:hypothetical protein